MDCVRGGMKDLSARLFEEIAAGMVVIVVCEENSISVCPHAELPIEGSHSL